MFRPRNDAPLNAVENEGLAVEGRSSSVLRAGWEFVHNPSLNFVLGDRAIQGLATADGTPAGYFMPLRKNFGVILKPGPQRKQLKWFDDRWNIQIGTSILTDDVAERFNLVMWHAARQEIYGPDPDQLLEIKDAAETVPESIRAVAQQYEGAQPVGSFS